MIQNYYPVDFEAQYQQTSEKMIEISKKYKDAILNANPISIQQIEADLEGLQVEMEENDLLFRKESIYSQFASGQLMAERRKQPPQLCPECGDEIKKQFQCQFCAQIFCKKCCYRNRVIPFVSKQQRLCCEQCHFKFVKLFDNKHFYEEKEKLINVLNFTRNKINKVFDKIILKKKDVQAVKADRRNQRIKEKNVEKKIQEEEKKVRLLQEELRKVVSEKAEKIKEQQKRKQLESQIQKEKQKVRIAEEERIRIQRQQQQMRQRQEEAQRLEQAKRKEREQTKNNERESEEAQKEKNQRQKQKQELKEAEIKKKYEQEMRRKEQQIEKLRKELQKSNEKKKDPSSSSFSSKKESQNIQTPKNETQKEKEINTAATSTSKKNRSRKSSSARSNNSTQVKPVEGRSRPSEGSLTTPVKTLLTEENKKKEESEEIDGLEKSFAKVFRVSKQDQSKSVVSNLSKTSKNIIDMSVNELLGLRIPVARSSSKIEQAEHQQGQNEGQQSEQNEDINAPVSPLSSRISERASIRIDNMNQPFLSKQDLQRERAQAIRNSTMISSSNKDSVADDAVVVVQNKKCQCLLM